MTAFLRLEIPENRCKQNKTSKTTVVIPSRSFFIYADNAGNHGNPVMPSRFSRLTLSMTDMEHENEQTENSVCSFLFHMPAFPSTLNILNRQEVYPTPVLIHNI